MTPENNSNESQNFVNEQNIENVKQEMLKRLAKYNEMGFESYNEFQLYMNNDPKKWKSPDEPLHPIDLKGGTYWLPLSCFEKGDVIFENEQAYIVLGKPVEPENDEQVIHLQDFNNNVVNRPESHILLYCGEYGWHHDNGDDNEDGNDIMLMKYFGSMDEIVPNQDTIPYFNDIDYENGEQKEIEAKEQEAKWFFDPELFASDGLEIVRKKYTEAGRDIRIPA